MMGSPPTIDLEQYWFILRRRWLPAVAAFVTVVNLAVLAIFLQKPVYQADGKIKLSNNKTSSLTSLQDNNEEENNISSLEALSQKSNPVETEAEEIRSEPSIQNAVTALNLTNEQGETLETEDFLENLTIVNIMGTDVLQLSYQTNDSEVAEAVVNHLMNFYLSTNISTNRAEASAARKFLDNQLPTIENKVLRAEAALREFKKKHKVVDLETEAKSSVEVIANLEGQIDQTKADIANSNAQSAMLRNRLDMSLKEDTTTTALSQSPAIQKALAEYQQLEGQLAVARTQYREDHPTVIDLKGKKGALEVLLQERVGRVLGGQKQAPNRNLQTGELRQKLTEDFVKLEVNRRGLANEAAALSNEQFTYQQRANILPGLVQTQRALERSLAVAQLTYETLLKNLQEARLAENQNLGNARIIQPAKAQKDPVAPSKVMYLGAGAALGLMIAIATALLLEAMDKSIKTVKEARELFGYTLLGTVPYLKGAEKANQLEESNRLIPTVPVRDTPGLSINEAYRMLQANLKFLSSDRALKVIVVTSSVPKEGKSTVSANMAMAMAQMGHKVLLVDADMRCPVQHQIWRLSNTVGLSNVITGQAQLGSERVIKAGARNLDILTSGVLPPNPLALLDSRSMASLITSLCKNYNYVVIDTPPLTVAADALTLGKMASGVLMVVRPGVANSASAAFAKESLEQSSQLVLGLVINGVIPENESDNYYYTQGYYTQVDKEFTTNGRHIP